ncbi:MAG: hypothetical protein AABN95_19425 [Acidobacteriota bacterium]
MSADSLFAVNASCQFALIIVGVIVAVKPQTGVDRPWLVIGLFVVLGGIGMVAAVRQQQVSARETAEAQRQLSESNAKLSSSIEKAAEIAQGAIGASTGGESFCYLTSTWRRDDGTPVIWVFAQQGKSPLYDVQVMVLDLQFYDPSKIERGKESHLPFKIGDMPVGSVWANLDVDIPFSHSVDIPFNKAKKERHDYQINFTARNGWWTQDLLWQKVGDRWLTATRVFREGPDPSTLGTSKKLIFTKIDDGFPGEPDWYPGKEVLENSQRHPPSNKHQGLSSANRLCHTAQTRPGLLAANQRGVLPP